MITYEEFVRELGSDADNYTEDQLQQLHRDVQVFARIIVEVLKAKAEKESVRNEDG